MKKRIVYLLSSIALILATSCSKDEAEPEVINSAAKISNETGLSFSNSSGFSGDFVTFKLRRGTGDETEYGQSLSSYSHIELEQGYRTIYQIKVFEEGQEVSFKSYTYDSEGNKIELKTTSIIEIGKNEVMQILLENAE